MCLARLNYAPGPLLSEQKEMTLLEVLQKPQLLVLCPLTREVAGWVVSQQMQQLLPVASLRARAVLRYTLFFLGFWPFVVHLFKHGFVCQWQVQWSQM
jgi:hypothetical protein